jgi:hypothetical protein
MSSRTNEEVAREWHRYVCEFAPWPEDASELPISDDFQFVGPPMSFTRDAYVKVIPAVAPAWMTAGGPTEIVAQYGDGEHFTTVFTAHTATSDERITFVHTSRVVDGLVTNDWLAYDLRVAYNQVDGLEARLDGSLGDVPGATYGLP